MKNKKGFTLAELLIVVAIIGVLVAISIPIFNNQLEKARRAVDIHTARDIESILATAVNDGSVQFPSQLGSNNYSIWVTLARDENSFPKDYKKDQIKHGTLFCGVDPGTTINGVSSNPWNAYHQGIENLLTNSGLNVDTLKITSKSNKNNGWDWIVINVGYNKNKQLSTRIYSGMANADSEPTNTTVMNNSNIAKYIGGQN
ncbi:type II secretion system protein [Blautia sp. HCP3S3_H10_1]|uniref:type II secretion system protein n=1 Tax=unclassified Blautia TaxID=2648079 RepID=UPI003F93B923